MASSREILINLFFYFLFPQLQSVLIWHVLYAMVRGKYQQAAHIQHRHFWYLLVLLPSGSFPLTPFPQACCACVWIGPPRPVAYVPFDFLGKHDFLNHLKSIPFSSSFILFVHCDLLVKCLSSKLCCMGFLSQRRAVCIRILTWTFCCPCVTSHHTNGKAG